jgi:hypothetical protein
LMGWLDVGSCGFTTAFRVTLPRGSTIWLGVPVHSSEYFPTPVR